MEPTSLALSVAAAIDTAVKLVELLHDIKEGGKQRIRLTAEISALWLVLENINTQLDELLGSTSRVPAPYLKTLSNPGGPLVQCSELLTNLYDKCRPKTGAGRVLQALRWPFEKDEIDRYLHVLHRLQTSIALAYAQSSLMILNTISEDTAITRHTLEEQSSKKLFEWLSPLDFEAQQRQAYSELCPGTVKWVLDLPEYKNFKEGGNPYLWLPSPLDAGRQLSVPLILMDLRGDYPPGGDTAVVGVYLTSRSTGDNEFALSEIMGSLLKQLCHQGYGPDAELRAAYHSAIVLNSKPSIGDIKTHTKRLLSPIKHSYLVIDAIDELQPHQQRVQLIDYLKGLSGSLSILMAGRPYPELSGLCAPLHHVCDTCGDGQASGFYHCDDHLRGGWDVCTSCFGKGTKHCPTGEHPEPEYLASTLTIHFMPRPSDISLYAHRRIATDENLTGLFRTKESLKAEVIEKVVAESGNKFLIAKLYLNHLGSFDRARDIKNAIKRPLGNIDHTYSQALEDLLAQRPDRVRLAKEAIKWISFARIPIEGTQLEQAVQFSLEGDEFDEDDVVPINRLIEFACGFLTRSTSGYVEFTHFTADEFLAPIVSEWFPDGALETTVACLQFLSRSEFKREWPPEELSSMVRLYRRFPFHEYAARSWPVHMRQGSNEAVAGLLMEYLKDQALISFAELHLSMSNSHPRSVENYLLRPRTALHLAADCRLEDIVLELLDRHIYQHLDTKDYLGRTPLWTSASNGQAKAVRALLDAGASPDMADPSGWTPLLMVIERHHDDAVEALITHPSRPADVNFVCSGTSFPNGDVTPLIAAVLSHNNFAIRLLLEHPDIDINTACDGATALSFAASEGNVEGARMLVADPRCNINQASDGTTALHMASAGGHDSMVELLLESGAAPDAVDAEGMTPIMNAISRGRSLVMGTLIMAGASLQIKDKTGWTVLHHNTSVGSTEAASLLCSHEEVRSLIDEQDEAGNTALHLALRWNHEQLARLLVALGGSVDVVSNDGMTARHLAGKMNIDILTKPESNDQDLDQDHVADALATRSTLPMRTVGTASISDRRKKKAGLWREISELEG